MLSADEVKPLLLHEDSPDRDMAVDYFHDSWSQDPTLVPMKENGSKPSSWTSWGSGDSVRPFRCWLIVCASTPTTCGSASWRRLPRSATQRPSV